MAVITIDGRTLEVPDGKNVLECALEAGIYIPHLCHHPDLPDNGSCRMCVVEVEGCDQVERACMLEARDGLNITTTSERVNKLRTLALELLLGCHPEDCSTCPKYGNCELQTLIQYIGANNARVKNRSRGFKMNEENPLLIHDMNRCVLCGRCVRACNKVRGVGVIDYRKKDMETYIGTLHDKLLIDADCRFCTACAEVCPTGTIRDKKVYSSADGTREEFLIPCKNACPAHTDVPRYIRYVKEGKFDEAAAVIREKAPFPKVLGYICNHVCELECKRREVSEAMSIRNIKRFAAEQDTGSVWKGKGKQLADTGKKVCVVGAGPAGMTAAYYLRKQGHAVTVKEALPTVGGMMGYGIPSYRLPRTIIEEEATVIREAGVVIECNAKVEHPADMLKEYDAVLMAIGAHQGVRLPMEGAELNGTVLNIDFLRSASLMQLSEDVAAGAAEDMIAPDYAKAAVEGKRVIVLGGGNVAFDCARTAKRLGAAEIHLACLEAREAMTADEEEILQATEEGICVHPAQTFERITGTETVTGVDFMNVKSFTFDENRRAIIEKEEGSEHHIDADTVIFAVGQRPDIHAEEGLELGRGNCITVGDKSLASSVEGIFAAGDVVYGTKSVIQAIASGRDAAKEIDKYLGGDGDISEILAPVETPDPWIGKIEGFGYEKRMESEVTPAAERQDNFGLVDQGICADSICAEAGRCLQCDLRLQLHTPRLWTEFSNDVKEEA